MTVFRAASLSNQAGSAQSVVMQQQPPLVDCRVFVAALLFLFCGPTFGIEFPGPAPGRAVARVRDEAIRLGNRAIEMEWRVSGRRLRPVQASNKLTAEVIDLSGSQLFEITLANGICIRSSDLSMLAAPRATPLEPDKRAARLAERSPGRQVSVQLVAANGDLEVDWRALLRDGANAVRQEISIRPKGLPVKIKSVGVVDLPSSAARVIGTVPGSLLATGHFFAACEHPDAISVVTNRATSGLAMDLALAPNQAFTLGSTFGVVPAGQMRRGFLYYVERERAHPYRPFPHYNAWYDICWGNRKIREDECLAVIDMIGRELVRDRGVPLASFVWDDGWDDPQTLWRPLHANFPNGFTTVLERARSYDSTLGFWLSPFGGYGKPAQDRIAMGKNQGFETGPQGFSLAGTNYHTRFRETCLDFIDKAGANFFKFDGLARGVEETDAMLRLTQALRARKPDLFISITTGTWPSPFWLWWGDSTWRGGDDMGFHGQGSKREQWVTYRDMETYRRVVQPAPLYPLNSLMNQGFPLARYGFAAEVGVDSDEVRRELRSLFASGTCLLELYVTPSRMTSKHWNDLAESARWARARTDLFTDTHWVGGDPGTGQVYGWASWSPSKAVIALRNPLPFDNTISLDIGQVFELPPRAPREYCLTSPWREEQGCAPIHLEAGKVHAFTLPPFGVAVWDALPQ